MRSGSSGTSSEAVSSVIAQLLLIGVVTAAGSILLATQLSSVSSFNTNFGTLLGFRASQLQETFIVDDVWFNSSNRVHISVFNYGRTQITVSTVLINDTVTSGSLALANGDRAWFTVTNFSWESGKIYFIRVATSQGTVYETFWKS